MRLIKSILSAPDTSNVAPEPSETFSSSKQFNSTTAELLNEEILIEITAASCLPILCLMEVAFNKVACE